MSAEVSRAATLERWQLPLSMKSLWKRKLNEIMYERVHHTVGILVAGRVFLVCFNFCFWPRRMACRILVPQPGIEPRPLAVRACSPNHWTTREFPWKVFLKPEGKTSGGETARPAGDV